MANSKTIHLIRRGPGWVPADEHAEAWTQKHKANDEVMFEQVHSKIEPKELRKFFVMIRKVIDAQGIYKNTEELRAALLIATGRYDWRRSLFGDRYEHPHSFTEMTNEEFLEFKRDAVRLIAEQLGIDAIELMRPDDGTKKWEGPIP